VTVRRKRRRRNASTAIQTNATATKAHTNETIVSTAIAR
jgi:hypothetical protein